MDEMADMLESCRGVLWVYGRQGWTWHRSRLAVVFAIIAVEKMRAMRMT